VITGLCLALVAALWSGEREEDWPTVWNDLARLEALGPQDEGVDELVAALAAVAREERGTARGELLSAHLDRRAGRPIARPEALAELRPDELSGPETWLLAGVLPAGPARVRALLAALERTPAPGRDELLLAWRSAVDEARALRLAECARPLQEILHERYRAPWSAIDLALTCSRLGDEAGVARVLGETIAHEEAAGRSSADLWSTWGNAVLGFGDESRARDYLGRALARGSTNAALVLGRLELDAGRLEAARMSFRPSILSERPAAWAVRGWGTSLLPAPHTPPVGGR
jgi:hypothetical protein